MRLTSFGLKGILAYQASEACVDAAALPSGLIALTGENGHGKTTLLETPLAAVFRSFPSRAEKELATYTFTSDGYLEVTFELEGRGQYRARVNVDGPKRKSSAVLEFVAPDGTRTPMNDGKVTTFAAAIRQLLPPPELFLASVFAAQNLKGSFVNLSNAERKELFAVLLGLAQLTEMADRAKKAERLAAEALVPLRSARAVLARDADPAIADELQERANVLQAEGGEIELRRVAIQEDLRAIERALEERQAAAAAHAAAQTKVDTLELELQGLRTEHEAAVDDCAQLSADLAAEQRPIVEDAEAALAAIDRQRLDTTAYQAELRRIDEALEAASVDPRARLAKNQALLEDQAAVEDAAQRTRAAEEQMPRLRADERAIREELEVSRRRERAVAEQLAALAVQERELETARQGADLLTRVPFGDACSPCQFMVNAVAAKAALPALVDACAKRPELETAHRQLVGVIDTTTAHLETTVEQIRQLEHTIATHGERAKNAAFLEGARDRIKQYDARLEELAADAERQREAAHERESARVNDLAERRAQRDAQGRRDLAVLVQRNAERRATLEQRVDSLAQTITEKTFTLEQLRDDLATSAAAASEAAAQKVHLQRRLQDWDESTRALARVTSQREELDRRRALYAGRRAELEDLDRKIAAIAQHQVEWQVLARACSRDGLQTIEIDEAGPTVSAYTNDILRACYGPRFTVEIVTQEAKATKGRDGSTVKETFEVKVWDSERGGPARDIADLSGGEKVIVDEALKSAIAILVNERNQFPIRTCWRDETTGPLSAENRPRYLAMLRRVHELGGFHQTFFVTHDTPSADEADAQLVVDNGQVDVRLPPYGRRAAA